MFSHLVARDEINEAQAELEDTMRHEFPKIVQRNITFRPNPIRNAQVSTNGQYWYYTYIPSSSDVTTPKFVNMFGIVGTGRRLRITVEVNVVREGQNNQVRGFFARDSATGAIYLMHTGDVGGGARGVGGHAFRTWHGEPRNEVQSAVGNARLGYIVVPVNALTPTRPLIRYVDRIDAFKRAIANREIQIEGPEFQREMRILDDFYKEPRGRRTGYYPGEIDYISLHGDIVDALHHWRMEQKLRPRFRIVKNVFIDMGVEDSRGRLVELYEVKTSTARSDVYSALGQLIVHGPPSCKKVIVLPEEENLADDLMVALMRHGIALLRFELDDEGAPIIVDTVL